MKNRALKISVSIPLKIVEELDQLTTYKGRSRSKWITNAITERLKGFEATPDIPERKMMAMLFASTTNPYVKLVLGEALNPTKLENRQESKQV
jgi:metal-responsive CopG/Arc/MetJ family transcriptional regulator